MNINKEPAAPGKGQTGLIADFTDKHSKKTPRVKAGTTLPTDNRDGLRDVVINRLVKKVGLRAKVNAKCAECIYDPYSDGTWRLQVEKCTSSTCPLYTVRTSAKYSQGATA